MGKILSQIEKTEKDKNNNIRNKETKGTEETLSWDKIKKTVINRSTDNCAICCTALSTKALYVTSCSHCYHKNCLDQFERFDLCLEKRCPICRQNYEKKEITLK